MDEDRPNYYSILPANVRYDDELKDKAKLLYSEITALCNKNGYCYASNKYFADLYKVDISTISRIVKQLINRNYIESTIVYKEGTKEIVGRILKPVDINTYRQKSQEGYRQKSQEGIGNFAHTYRQKSQDNNINNNNINNNNTSFNINNTHPYPLSCHNTNDYDCVDDSKQERQNKFFEEHPDIKEILDFWNSKKIIVHRTYTKSLINQIIDKIKIYGKDNILNAIDHYSTIYFDESYKILHYKWTLETFLKQGNCLPDFMDDGIKWQNYLESKSGKKLQEKQFMNSFDYSKFFDDDNGGSNE